MINCLHIAAHYGGGVGSTVVNVINCFAAELPIANTVVALDKLVNRTYVDSLTPSVPVYEDVSSELDLLSDLIRYSDIVLIHYWNHPLLAVLLSTLQFPPCKIVFWIHTSGLHEPNVVPNYLYYVGARVIFTSAISCSLPEASILTNRKKISVARSAIDINQFLHLYSLKQYECASNNALYVGTVSRQKMHPASISIFRQLAAAGVSIDIVGEPTDSELVDSLDDCSNITFHGYKPDITAFLIKADCFIYPLKPSHYGTGELVLVEAMASGLPCICMDNPAEALILDHGINGYLSQSISEFVDNTLSILGSKELQSRLSHAAHLKAATSFSLEATVQSLYSQLFSVHRENSSFFQGVACAFSQTDPVLGAMIKHSFAASTADNLDSYSDMDFLVNLAVKTYQKIYKDGISLASVLASKGSPAQYLSYYPESCGVANICSVLESCQE